METRSQKNCKDAFKWRLKFTSLNSFIHFSAALWLKQVACGLVHRQGCGCEIQSYSLANVYLDWLMVTESPPLSPACHTKSVPQAFLMA